jgi:hypothetical protein
LYVYALGPLTALALAVAAGATPEGRWATIDDHTGEVRAIVRVRIDNGCAWPLGTVPPHADLAARTMTS